MDSAGPDRGIWYFGITLACTVISAPAVILRLYTRAWLTRSFGSDDFMIILPLFSTVGQEVVDILDIYKGLGHHTASLTPQEVETINKNEIITWIRAFITYFFVRASVMLFTLRLLPCTKKWPRRTIYVTFFLNFAITLIACVCYGAHCTPFRAAYADVPGGSCKSGQLLVASQQVNGVLASIIDITTALIPAFLLWDLQMRRKTKIFLDIIFCLGLLTAGLSIGRAVTTTPSTWGPDSTYTETIPGILSAVEIKMGMFFASCPMIRQFIRYILREKSMLPTNNRTPPNSDFVAMRKRVVLRDIFWFRKAEAPKGNAPSPKAKPNQPHDISAADRRAKFSALDRIWALLRHGKKPSSVEPDKNADSVSEKGLVGDQVVPGNESGEVTSPEAIHNDGRQNLKAKKSGETFLWTATHASADDWPLGAGSARQDR